MGYCPFEHWLGRKRRLSPHGARARGWALGRALGWALSERARGAWAGGRGARGSQAALAWGAGQRAAGARAAQACGARVRRQAGSRGVSGSTGVWQAGARGTGARVRQASGSRRGRPRSPRGRAGWAAGARPGRWARAGYGLCTRCTWPVLDPILLGTVPESIFGHYS